MGKPRRKLSRVEVSVLADLIEDGDVSAFANMLGTVARHLEGARKAMRKWDAELDDKACLEFVQTVWAQLDEPGTARDRFALRLLDIGVSRDALRRRLKVSSRQLTAMLHRARKAKR